MAFFRLRYCLLTRIVSSLVYRLSSVLELCSAVTLAQNNTRSIFPPPPLFFFLKANLKTVKSVSCMKRLSIYLGKILQTGWIGIRLFHHCRGNSTQSYFWEATSRFNVNLHFSEYLVSVSSLQWRYLCLLYDSIFEMPIMFVKYLQWQKIHSKM